ncbi:TerB family tellurite resistance protein [Roseobacter sp. N2S]|uniref:tellurite resistance TerB family protein n=1 Tax=Roseobacter sp. N2S TaxID=2663844 RepID=UPI00285D7AB8|nr:TerB family tellurite resistance protein [Roseobacter sp. N2S]MDR6264243.1 putative tellurite resistance protein B-like protein [Roseobacter sp. N2S]
MFQALIDLFTIPDARTDLQPEDARAALATLMVRIARADDSYDEVEHQMILDVLQHRYHLSLEAAQELKADAERLEAKAPDTVRFTKIVKDAVPYDDRIGVVEALWRVAMADGQRDHQEDGFLRLVVNLLGVNDRDSGLARQRVIADLENG